MPARPRARAGKSAAGPVLTGVVALASAIGTTPRAQAQARWDIGAQLGATERIVTSRPADAPAPLPGPVAEVQGHVALLPMIRVGAYAAYDASPARGRSVREITAAGLHVRLVPPLRGALWRTWVFAGAGYGSAYQPSYTRTGIPPVFVGSAAGGFVDVRLGIGAGVRFRPPWSMTAELGAGLGGWFAGSLYHPPGCGCGGRDEDSFALTLTVGVSLDR